jgi:hypothetical protein
MIDMTDTVHVERVQEDLFLAHWSGARREERKAGRVNHGEENRANAAVLAAFQQ